VAGVYAAGDVRSTPLRQIATAVGDAAIAAFSAEHYLENVKA
jgi:thioredoxin reductase (NADPH)